MRRRETRHRHTIGRGADVVEAHLFEKVDGRRVARKSRQKKTSDAVDGRSLRATGRTEHLNFKATPRIKQALAKHVPKGKTSLWLEEAIIEKLKREGVEVDA